MKVYIILEGHYDRIIRGATFSHYMASKICESFSHLGLFIEEYETMENEELRDFLNETLK